MHRLRIISAGDDACLIAELLAALRELTQHIVFDPEGVLDRHEFEAMIARGAAAVAKAEGR